MVRVGVMALGLMLASCARAAPVAATSPAGGIDVGDVALRVKQEIGYFEATEPRTEAEWRDLFIRSGLYAKDGTRPLGGVCGDGKIRIHIEKIDMDFIAAYDDAAGAKGGVKIPFAPENSGSAGAGATLDEGGGIELHFTYFVPATLPATAPDTPSRRLEDIIARGPIANALIDLRDGLIRAAGQKPCFLDRPEKQKDPVAETAIFSVKIVRSGNVEAGFDLWIVNASANGTVSGTRSSKITVTYSVTSEDEAALPAPGAHPMFMMQPRPNGAMTPK